MLPLFCKNLTLYINTLNIKESELQKYPGLERFSLKRLRKAVKHNQYYAIELILVFCRYFAENFDITPEFTEEITAEYILNQIEDAKKIKSAYAVLANPKKLN